MIGRECSSIDVTVAICTWNRASSLDRTLASACRLRIPPGVAWELVIVNNNCSDSTDEVIGRHAGSIPLRRLFQQAPGKSAAANLAVREARGELVLWTDDDVIVDQEWLASYVSAAERWPEAAFFGGPVEPWYEIDPPPWIRENIDLLELVYAIRRAEEGTRILDRGEHVWGANMAVRRSIQSRFPFDGRIGPSGSNQVRGEEILIQQDMLTNGYHGAWVGTARVKHNIPAARLTREYVRAWYRGDGRGSARLEGALDCVHLMGFPRYALRSYLMARIDQARRRPGTRRWVESFTSAARLEGFLAEYRKQRRLEGGRARGRGDAAES